MHWDNDLVARPEDTVETEPRKKQPLPLTPEELTDENDDIASHPSSATKDTKFIDDPPDDRNPRNTPWTPTIFSETTRSL